MIHAPRQTVDKERRSARLGKRCRLRVEEVRFPVAVGILNGRDLRRHLAEERLVTLSVRIVGGHVLQNASEPGQDPSVSSAPEDLFSVGAALVEEAAVTEVEMF